MLPEAMITDVEGWVLVLSQDSEEKDLGRLLCGTGNTCSTSRFVLYMVGDLVAAAAAAAEHANPTPHLFWGTSRPLASEHLHATLVNAMALDSLVRPHRRGNRLSRSLYGARQDRCLSLEHIVHMQVWIACMSADPPSPRLEVGKMGPRRACQCTTQDVSEEFATTIRGAAADAGNRLAQYDLLLPPVPPDSCVLRKHNSRCDRAIDHIDQASRGRGFRHDSPF
jgi:hypothetical protein